MEELQLVFDMLEDDSVELPEAEASINLNKEYATAVKFVLTDSKPNANRQRVPEEEFSNLISTGIGMPIKAASLSESGIPNGHEGAYPIGAITHLKRVGDKILGLALLWKKEREEDVATIKSLFESKTPLQLSWELGYKEASIDESGIEDLHGVVMRATTLVGLPAYAGRTPILAVASVMEEPTVEKTELETRIAELESKIAELEQTMVAKDEELASVKTETEALREFKSAVEKVEAEKLQLASVKEKFSNAKVAKEDSYFDTNKEMLLNMTEAELDFMLQELASFAVASASLKTQVTVPNLTGNKESVTPTELGKALRNYKR